jgi:hypothetical protein
VKERLLVFGSIYSTLETLLLFCFRLFCNWVEKKGERLLTPQGLGKTTLNPWHTFFRNPLAQGFVE